MQQISYDNPVFVAFAIPGSIMALVALIQYQASSKLDAARQMTNL
jgi:hypothetical protein